MIRVISNPGQEKHNTTNWLRDVILGGQDGLVNVLGIVLGLTAANADSHIIIIASLAATFAEAVSMGAVAFTSTLADKNYYEKEKQREEYEVEHFPEIEITEVRNIYRKKGFEGELLDKVVSHLTKNKTIWVDTMMEEELGLKKVNTTDIYKSSMVVAVAAVLGAIIPIVPYFFLSANIATGVALIISSISLFAIGVYQARTYVGNWWKKGLQMLLIGMGAALAGFLIGKLL